MHLIHRIHIQIDNVLLSKELEQMAIVLYALYILVPRKKTLYVNQISASQTKF